jgi:hypothetical protein
MVVGSVRHNYLTSAEGLPRDAQIVGIDGATACLILPLGVQDLLTVCQGQIVLLLLLFDLLDFIVILVLVEIDREKVVSLDIPKQNAQALKAEILGQYLSHIVDVVGIGSLRGDQARYLDCLRHLSLRLSPRRGSYQLVDLELDAGGEE